MDYYLKKIMNPFVTKKQKERIINENFEIIINNIFSCSKPKKVFQILYDLNYNKLVSFYMESVKSYFSGSLRYLNIIPIDYVSSEFLNEICDADEIINILNDNDVTIDLKRRLVSNFHNQIKIKVSKFGVNSIVDCLLNESIDEFMNIILEEIKNSRSLEEVFDILKNSDVSDEVKGKIFMVKQIEIEEYFNLYKNDVTSHPMYFSDYMYIGVKNLAINCLKDETVGNDIGLLEIFSQKDISMDTKKQILEIKETKIDKILDSASDEQLMKKEFFYDDMDQEVMSRLFDELNESSVGITKILEVLMDPNVSDTVKDRLFLMKENEIIGGLFRGGVFKPEYLNYAGLMKAILNKKCRALDIEEYILNNALIANDVKESIFLVYEEEFKNIIKSEHKTSGFFDIRYGKIIDLKISLLTMEEILECLSDNMFSNMQKDRIFNFHKASIVNFIKNADMFMLYSMKCFNSEMMYPGVIDIVMQNIYNIAFDDLLFNLLCDNNISNEIKEKLFTAKEKEIDELLLVGNFDLVAFLSLDNAENLYEPLFNKILNVLSIEQLFEILLNDKISNTLKDKIIEQKKSEFDDFLTQMFSNDEKMEKIDLGSLLIAFNSINYDLFNKVIELINREQVLKILVDDRIPDDIKERVFILKEKEIDAFLLENVDFNILIRYDFDEMYSRCVDKIIDYFVSNYDSYNDLEKDVLIIKMRGYNDDSFKAFLKRVYNLNDDLLEFVVEVSGIFNGNRHEFISNLDKISMFLSNCGIDKDKYFQYCLANNYDWLHDMMLIINTGQFEKFNYIKNVFLSTYLPSKGGYNVLVNNFNYIMKNYIRYPDLMFSIASSSRNLSQEELEQVEFLFSRNISLFGNDKYKPKNIDDCGKIKEAFLYQCNRRLFDVENMDLDNLKNVISIILFDDTFENMINKLKIYGASIDLEQLKFNNRDNKQFLVDVSVMEELTIMVEEIVNCNDINNLRVVASNILRNPMMANEISRLFAKYEDNMRKMYEYDIKLNLTSVSTKVKKMIKDENKSSEYGVEVYDFSDKNYILCTHVKSARESIEDLVYGTSTKNSNFICLSAISHRNQVYYGREPKGIIFGYDNIPAGNFVCSSIANMGSNGGIRVASSDFVGGKKRKQRGILETSAAPNDVNSEILCFRENMIPKYIVLPGGREPTQEELEIAKKYGLAFAVTQKIKTKINNPQKIEDNNLISTMDVEDDDLEDLRRLRNALVSNGVSNKNKKIAIIADAHGLYEPTLAVLQDARKNGVDEIYSLGDNIGTGPNPSQVMELLEKYGVKSVVGNHELYVTEGVDAFKRHFDLVGGYQTALKNSLWTGGQLTERQLESLKLFPKTIELSLGGKKLLLCHSIKDYNENNKLIVSLDDYDRVFQGHIHFKESKGNVTTVRGTGIGYADDNQGQAFYVILTEKPDGGYEISEKYVPFDSLSLSYDIDESSLELTDKDKIASWAGVKR